MGTVRNYDELAAKVAPTTKLLCETITSEPQGGWYCTECSQPIYDILGHIRDMHPRLWEQCIQAFRLLSDSGWSYQSIAQHFTFFSRANVSRALKSYRAGKHTPKAKALTGEQPGIPSAISQRDIANSLSSPQKTAQLLRELKKLKPSDKWFEQEIFVDSAFDKPLHKKRREVADYLSADTAATQIVKFWNEPETEVTPQCHGGHAKRRSVRIAGRKLILCWKGTYLEAIGREVEFQCRLTVARVDQDKYAVFREHIP